MKKLLPLLLATSLLLSACSIDWSNRKENIVSEKSMFEQKQECEKYITDANKYYNNNDGWVRIFYSKKLDTCIVVFISEPEMLWNYNPEDPTNPITRKYIYDYLTKELILQTEDGELWNNKIKELKWE